MSKPFVDFIAESAADIAASAPGLPYTVYETLAEHVLSRLVQYQTKQSSLFEQDVNYLARMFQAVHEDVE